MTAPTPDAPFNGHHIWCNMDSRKPVSECRQCKGLYERYPWTPDDDPIALVKQHFPNAAPVPPAAPAAELADDIEIAFGVAVPPADVLIARRPRYKPMPTGADSWAAASWADEAADALAAMQARIAEQGTLLAQWAKDYAALDREVEQAEAALAAQARENMCDACAGTGTPTSGKPCMCGGSGKMSDAARYLREQLFGAEARADSLQAKVDALMLEYCPDEMTPEQIAEWEKNQVRASPEQEAAIDAALASEPKIDTIIHQSTNPCS